MDGLDLLGATGLSNQFITVRVKNIDTATLKNKIGGSAGGIASNVVTMVDVSPKAALDAALPIARSKAKEYGIDADIVVSDAPPPLYKRAFSEFWPGLLVGTVLGGSGLLIAKFVQRLVRKKA